jgi:subtilisin family serine protease
MDSKRRVALTASLLVASSAGLFWLGQLEPITPAARTASNPTPPEIPKPGNLATPAQTTSQNLPAAPNSHADSSQSWVIHPDGQALSITLALDEAILRDADGKESLTRLIPAATQENLPARLAGLSSPGGVFPVAYLTGQERSTATRRILTPDLRVQLDEAAADDIASRKQLTIKDRPAYAPGWVIMRASDAFAALDAMAQLRKLREVTSADILLAVQHTPRALPNDPLITDQWHLKRSGTAVTGSDVNIESIWNYPSSTGARGKGIRIGIVDDGLQTTHPDFIGNIDTANDKDWNGNDADPSPGTDDDHGTSCAGNAAARGNNGIGVSGTAPEATLVGMRLIAGSVTDAQEAEALNYLPQLIEIKSNSWGPNDTGDILEAPGPLTLSALQTATSSGRNGKGSIILWAGGNGGDVNDNSNYDGYANSIYTIAIGATDSTGKRAYYSEPGSNIVVCAPSSGGLGITTVDRAGTAGYSTGDYANDFGGTSSATPTAAGIVALMLEKNPNLGWRDVQEILIRSAAKPPAVTTTGWVTNSAGIPFHHEFGAGLIDASAAVNLSASWTNLPAQTSTTVTQSGLSNSIPNNNPTGLTRSFDLTSSNIRVEQVTLKLSATHSARGNLEITLTSPGGMASKLAEVRSDLNPNYANWTFSSVRNWGENSAGIWTLKITDLSNTGNSTGGTLTSAELKVFGSPATPVNPSPIAQITQPSTGSIFSPGTPVSITVNASDLTTEGASGSIASVEISDNASPLTSITTPPYTFTYTPALGSHSLVAKATDSEGAVGNSVSVNFTVVNQSPLITAATLSSAEPFYTDTPLSISSITATDPEAENISYSYQWQSSSNGTRYTDLSGATLDTAPALAGVLLRCIITASDGNSNSPPFTTAAVNSLVRPSTTAAIGDAFSYTSGLVLRGTDSPIARRAILHEFSQGPTGGSSEWIEILTLQTGSLANWDLQDSANDQLVFTDSPIWDAIPAGTRIVIYNGNSKDPLLSATDDLDPADGKMLISSTDPTYFDARFASWISLGNNGDSITLNDENSAPVHSIAYGNITGTSTTPNIGSVGGGKSAHYTGDSDTGANLATQWRVTTSITARQGKALRVAGDLFISEYVEGSSNNKALEIYNPSSTSISLAGSSYQIEIYSNGASTAGSTINLTGTIAPLSTFVIKNNQASAGIVSQLTSGSLSHNGDDAIILKKNGVIVDRIGQVGVDPGQAWLGGGGTISTMDQTLRRKPSILQGNINSKDSFDPALEWDTYPIDTFSGLGSHTVDATPTTPSLALAITPNSFSENAGNAAALGTLSIPTALLTDLTVSLLSSDPSEATVPATITIPAGQITANFTITAVDDSEPDGSQSVNLSATASSHTGTTSTLTVTDDEVSLEGVTPGNPNSPANARFVTALREGSLNSPAPFRISNGGNFPLGLTLDTLTGVISGTLSTENPAGDYLILIERYNTLGESVSQSFTLTLTPGAGPTNSFGSWIATYQLSSLNGFGDDSDGDGLANGLENFLGSAPNSPNSGLTLISMPPGGLIFRHARSNTPADDLEASYEWSANLSDWTQSGGTLSGTSVTLTPTVITDRAAPENDLVEVSATTSGTSPAKLFVRLKAALASPSAP